MRTWFIRYYLWNISNFLSALAMYQTSKLIKNKNIALVVASLWPTIFNALIVGWVVSVSASLPLFITMLQVGFGEIVVITIVGVPVFKLLEKTKLKEIL